MTNSRNIVVVAHRGQVAGFPENTLAAFRQSVALGFSAIEVDLRTTRDGHIVILHDDTVDKTTDGSGAVGSLTLAEVKALDAGRGERIPTYEEVLAELRGSGVKLLLDIKTDGGLDNERVVRLTERYDAAGDVIVGPRTIADLLDFRHLNSNLRTLAFVGGPEFEPADVSAIEEFARAGADLIRLWPPWIFAQPSLIEHMRELGKPVWTTADVEYRDIDPDHPAEQLAELVRLGVEGIITDVPELLASLLATR